MNDFLPPGDYLPHAPPMVLLDKIHSVGDDSAVCRVKVDPEGVLAPFLDSNNALPGWFALEIMAQTIGVWSGWHGLKNGEIPNIGLLLGTRGLRCERPSFPQGSELVCHIHLSLRDEKLGSFECAITLNGEQVASARLNTYQPDEQEIEQLLSPQINS